MPPKGNAAKSGVEKNISSMKDADIKNENNLHIENFNIDPVIIAGQSLKDAERLSLWSMRVVPMKEYKIII